MPMNNSINLNLAPSQGLLLDEVGYEDQKILDDLGEETGIFDIQIKKTSDMLKFKRDKIYQYIVDV